MTSSENLVLSRLVGRLGAHHPTSVRAEALTQLSGLLDTSQGREGAELGEFLRRSGAIGELIGLLDADPPELHQPALLVLGNCAAVNVDPDASLTREVVKKLGGLQRILLHLYSDEWHTLFFALGATHNYVVDMDMVRILQKEGLVPKLHELHERGDAQLTVS